MSKFSTIFARLHDHDQRLQTFCLLRFYIPLCLVYPLKDQAYVYLRYRGCLIHS